MLNQLTYSYETIITNHHHARLNSTKPLIIYNY